jgi:hypothetical protein
MRVDHHGTLRLEWFLIIPLLEAFSKTEKSFEVKPPARRAYAPEGTAHGYEKAHEAFSRNLMNIFKYFEDCDSKP